MWIINKSNNALIPILTNSRPTRQEFIINNGNSLNILSNSNIEYTTTKKLVEVIPKLNKYLDISITTDIVDILYNSDEDKLYKKSLYTLDTSDSYISNDLIQYANEFSPFYLLVDSLDTYSILLKYTLENIKSISHLNRFINNRLDVRNITIKRAGSNTIYIVNAEYFTSNNIDNTQEISIYYSIPINCLSSYSTYLNIDFNCRIFNIDIYSHTVPEVYDVGTLHKNLKTYNSITSINKIDKNTFLTNTNYIFTVDEN